MERSDVTIINYYANRIAAELLRRRSALKRPWIFWGERPGYRLGSYTGRLLRRRRLRLLYRSKAPIWGIGRWAVERYQSEFGHNRHYANVPYHSDLRRFCNAQRGCSERKVFLFSGGLCKRKGIDLLGDAFSRLARREAKVDLVVLGEGPYQKNLQRRLAAVGDRVRWLGFRDWDDLPSVYAQCDFLCAPSRYDGWAMVVPEALAAGLPVIGTGRTGAALEFIRSGENGWLIPDGDADALHEAMRAAAELSECERRLMVSRTTETVSGHQLSDGASLFLSEAHYALSVWN